MDAASSASTGATGPLSGAQRRLLFLDELEPGSVRYVSRLSWCLRGRLDVDALGKALRAVVRRHDALRGRVVTSPDGPKLMIEPEVDVVLRVWDVREAPDPVEAGQRRLDAVATTAFDPGSAPLLGAAVATCGPRLALFQLTLHHLVFDGPSRPVLEADLSRAYADALAGDAAPALPPAPASFLAFTRAEEELRSSGELDGMVAAWRDRLADVPATLDLPAGVPPGGQSRAAEIRVGLDAETVRCLDEIAVDHRTSPFVVALAAHAYVLAVLGATEDPVVGVPAAGRVDPEHDDIVGMFVNSVAIRVLLSRSWRFHDLVDATRDRVLDALDDQWAPFDEVAAAVGAAGTGHRNPVFQHWFDLDDRRRRGSGLALAGVDATAYESAGTAIRFETETTVVLDGEESAVVLLYDAARFDAATMNRTAAVYRGLVAALVGEPARCLADLPLPGAPKRATTPTGFTATDVMDLLRARFADQPAAPAVSDRTTTLDYGELDQRSRLTAAALVAGGVAAGDVVAVAAPRTVDTVVALVAVLRIGAVYLPIVPSLPAARIDVLVQDARPRAVVAPAADEERWAEHRLPVIPVPVTLGAKGSTVSGPALPASADRAPDSAGAPAYLVHTSGSSGTPKGVLVTRAGLAGLTRWHHTRYAVSPADRVLATASMAFDAAAWEIWPSLAAGAHLEIAPEEVRTDAAALVDVLREHPVTLLFAPTPMAEMLIRQPLGDTAVRTLLTGGAVFRPRSQDRPGVPVVNHYGPTECTVVATATAQLGPPWPPITIGRAIPGVVTHILDGVGRPVPEGVVGELHLGGDGLALGYVGRPAATGAAFVPDGLGGRAGGRLYATGDLVRQGPGGDIQFLGRRDSQLAVRGHRVEPGEVEAAILAVDGVEDAAVVLVNPDGRAGSGPLVAWVSGERVDVGHIRAALARHLPAWMLPDIVQAIDHLPVTATGKPDRRALQAQVITRPAGRAPGSDIERRMCLLWQEVLGVDPIGPDDDFFLVGGSSLTASALVARVRRHFGTRLPLRTLFDDRTPGALCRSVRELARAEIDRLTDEETRQEIAALTADDALSVAVR